MGYASGEVQIPWLWSARQRGVAVFDNKIHVLGVCRPGVSRPYMAHATFDLLRLTKQNPSSKDEGIDLIDPAALGNPDNWKQNQYFYPPDSSIAQFADSPSVSLAANDGELWAFYSTVYDSSPFGSPPLPSEGIPPGFIASKFDPVQNSPDQNERWDSYALLDQAGHDLSGSGTRMGAAGARSFGATQFIVAAIRRVSNQPSARNSIYLGLYNTDDIDTDKKTWQAQASRLVDINSDIGYYFSARSQQPDGPHSLGYADAGKSLDIEWFPTLANGQLTYYLAISFTPEAPTNTAPPYRGPSSVKAFMSLPLTADGSQIAPAWGSDPLWAANTDGNPNDSGLLRDPAGRLRTYSFHNVQSQPFLFDNFFPTAKNPPSAAYLVPQGGPAHGVTDNSRPATGAFVVYQQGKTTVKVRLSSENGSPPVFVDADNYPVLEFVSYGAQHCQLNYFGDIRVIKDTSQLNQKPGQTVYVIGGIIDSPPPFPLVNYVGQTLAGDREETGTFTYGNDEEAEQEISDTSKWSVGFETSGEFSEGVGPAWDISVEGGMGSIGRETEGETLSKTLSAAGGVISKAPYLEPTPDADGAVQIVSACFHLTAYQFLDTNGTVISDALGSAGSSQAPSVSSALVTMVEGEPAASSFEPYCVTPGDLFSYTPGAINETMKNKGYEGMNYFGEIICANAFVWNDGTPFREFTWTNGGKWTSPAHVFTSSYQEQSWSFDGSLYAGVSGGFGIPEIMSFETKFMVGVKFSKEHEVGSSTTSTWGLEISEKWGPPNQLDMPDSVQQYSFRVYFLPVPKEPSALRPEYWATELKKNLKDDGPLTRDMVDPSSACWRIAFVVTNIVYRDSKNIQGYNYRGELDKTSVYANSPVGDKQTKRRK